MLTQEKPPYVSPNTTFEGRELRHAFGHFTTGVVIVTAVGFDGRKIGVTANSFTSVSLDPALVLWCPSKNLRSLPELLKAEYFVINVLAADQTTLSSQFASKVEDKFVGVDYETGLGGAPVLAGTVATFECRTYEKHDAGDHAIILGQVERFTDHGGEPLVFHSGTYTRIDV